MPSVEILAMLSLRGVEMGKAYGGIPEITQMDVAAMMRHCAPCEVALLRAKYVGDSLQDAQGYWYEHVAAQGFTSRRPGIVEDLANATLDEHISGLLCQMCGGTQTVLTAEKPVDCHVCADGRRNWSSREMARRLGISKLRAPWDARVEWCRGELRAWEREAIAKMRY